MKKAFFTSVAVLALQSFAAPDLAKSLKSLPGATNYVFHLTRDAFADSLGLDFDSLHPCGYYLARKGRDVVIAGRTRKGDRYALADFLKRYAGYRNFGTKFGLIAPQTDDLKVPETLCVREEPDVPSVYVAGHGGMGAFGRDSRLTCRATHALDRLVTKEMWEEHPEYFPLIRGERRKPGVPGQPWNPCMSNPDLPKLVDAYAERFFKAKPDELGLPMGVNDGGGDCQCDGCETLWRRHGNQYAAFYNMAAKRLAKSHPGKYLAFIAYSTRCKDVPRGIRMEPNILVEVTGMVTNMHGALRGWKDIGVKNFGVYEYLYSCDSNRMAPGYYPHDIAAYFRSLYREFGMKTLWQEYFAWAPVIDAGRQYVVNELMWNMEADVDSLLDDYFRSLYGPAEKPVRRFHEIAEAAYARRKQLPDWNKYFVDYHNPRQFGGYTDKALAAMDAALEEAARAAKGNEDVQRRIALLKRVWTFPRALIENWICVQKLKETDDPETIAALVAKASAAIARAERFTLTPDEERWVCCGKRGDKVFKSVLSGRLAPRPILDQAADDACFRATARLGREKSRSVWRRLGRDAVFAPYAGTQLYLIDNEPVNLAKNGSFEDLRKDAGRNSTANSDWRPLGVAGGWSAWTFPNTRALVCSDDSEAHTGRRSVCIRHNQHGAALITGWPAAPRTRYRVSAWVKTRNANGPGANLGGFGVRMKDAEGKWLDGGSAIGAQIPPEALEKWVRISCTFTTPDIEGDRLSLVPTLGAPGGQGDDDRVWWDDVTLEKLWEAPAKLPEQAAFALETAAGWTAGWKGVKPPRLTWDRSLPDDVYRAEKTADGGVVIIGGAEGLRLGVYAWCKALGIRWFSPNERVIIPAAPRAPGAAFFGEHRPSFPYRGLHTCGCPDHYDPNVAHWMSFNGFNRRLDDLREALVHRDDYARLGLVSDTTVHAYSLILPAEHYFEDHPDYFALIGGKRRAGGGQLCLSNRKMRAAFVASLKEWLAKLPDVSPVGICPNDGYGWCECKGCLALDTEEDRRNGTVNGRVADFTKFLAETFKDRTVGNYSYSNFADFYKLMEPLPPNLVLSFTAFHCQSHRFLDDRCPRNRTFARRFAELKEKGARFYIYDYYTHRWGFLPAPMWKSAARDFKEWKKAGIEGFLSEVSSTGAASWDSFWPTFCMAGEMMLDAERDPDDVIDDWCASRYGRAARQMREYFRVWEKGVCDERCFLKNPDEFPQVFQAEAESRLAAAEAADGENPFVRSARRRYDAWKSNLAERVRYVSPKEVAVSDELRRLPVYFTGGASQVIDAKNDTQVEMAVADGKVRVRLTAHETNMKGLKTAKSVYESDCFELFFADGRNAAKTYHFLADAQGRVIAAESEGKRWNWSWEHHATVKAERKADRWTLDFEMPLSDVAVGADEPFGFTLIRNRYAGGRWEITGTPAGGAFFDTSRYIRAAVGTTPGATP